MTSETIGNISSAPCNHGIWFHILLLGHISGLFADESLLSKLLILAHALFFILMPSFVQRKTKFQVRRKRKVEGTSSRDLAKTQHCRGHILYTGTISHSIPHMFMNVPILNFSKYLFIPDLCKTWNNESFCRSK